MDKNKKEPKTIADIKARQGNMKKYLNNAERHDILLVACFVDKIEGIIAEWEARGNLTKEERKSLKTCMTWGVKFFESVVYRQSKETILALDKATRNTYIYLETKSIIEELKKKKSSDIEKAYEENKDYYKLIELIFDNNCKGCTKFSDECDFFKELEMHYVPSMNVATGELYDNCKCKYSFMP